MKLELKTLYKPYTKTTLTDKEGKVYIELHVVERQVVYLTVEELYS